MSSLPISTAIPTRTGGSHEQRVAYVLLRLILGVNLLGHGVIRIHHGTSVFAAGMVKQMAETPLPPTFVSLFGHAIPWIELALGILLVSGFLTRWTLTAAMLFMTALMFGVTLHQDWPTAGLQLVYATVIFLLMYLRETNDLSWPSLLRPPGPRP